ncbi:MAG: tRNA lysidine(34) synthetase TilS [Fimbriimonas sp.]|nr:tRNA lysidine(34) synthetase TilS [Fimbriimonas sp.]
MFERFRRHLADSSLIPDGTRVLVGYSGGADSTALVHLLHRCGFDVVAGHLHHGQRPEADEEMSRCQEFADSLDVPFAGGRADVPRMSSDMGIGLEEAGRRARYGFFREAAYRLNCGLVATAHTSTDQVETVLLNVIRGSGLSGLAGIPEKRDNIVRPMLPFSREETRAYCAEHGFWTHDDPSNSDIQFSRARVRHRLISEMRHINSNVDNSILRLSEIAGEEDRFLNGMAAAALEQSESPLNGDLKFLTDHLEIRFDRTTIVHLPAVLARRGLRLACEALGASLDYDQTQIAYQGVLSAVPGSVSAEGGEVVIEWSSRQIDARRLEPARPFRYTLVVPGETISDELGWQFTAFEDDDGSSTSTRACLDASIPIENIRGTLYFRNLNPGDSMQPFGFSGRRKLVDVMSDAKLTQAARNRLPIVCDLVGPIWAPGVCLDERARRITGTGRVIRMRFGPIGP